MSTLLKNIPLSGTVIQNISLPSVKPFGKTIAKLSIDGELNDEFKLGSIDLSSITFEHDLSLIGNYTLGLKKTSVSQTYVISAGTNLHDALSLLFDGHEIEFG